MTEAEPVSSAKGTLVFLVCFLAVIIVAVALRAPQLEKRPMHGDEAVHAAKFGDLLEDGKYEYNPNDYHGPTLNYFTLIPAWLSSAKVLSQVDEYTLRGVPLFFGLALVVLVGFVACGIGRGAAVCAAVFTAISPSMVFYSRYYIQEMLLTFFGFGLILCGYYYVRRKRLGWAVAAGVFVGLMHATKETCVLAFAAMGVALAVVVVMRSREAEGIAGMFKGVKWTHIAAGVVSAVVVSVVFFSSFFTYGEGVIDSIRTYGGYLSKATDNQSHVHDWYYYLEILVYCRYGDGPIWSEGLIVALAVVGIVRSFVGGKGRGIDCGFVRFMAVYTVALAAIYSLIEYKTPWCLLGFLQGMTVLAGVGAVALVQASRRLPVRVLVGVLLVGGCVHLGVQAVAASYEYDSDPRNPHVYAHPTADVFAIVERIEAVASVHEHGRDMMIQVICPGEDYWPLPWYLRSFTKVYWLGGVDNDKPLAEVIIISPELVEDVMHKNYVLTPFEERNLYMPLFEDPGYMWLRPNVKLVGLVERDLWKKLPE